MRVSCRLVLLVAACSGWVWGCGAGSHDDSANGGATLPPVDLVNSVATAVAPSDTPGLQKVATESGAPIAACEGVLALCPARVAGAGAISVEKDAAASGQVLANVTQGGGVRPFRIRVKFRQLPTTGRVPEFKAEFPETRWWPVTLSFTWR